MSFCTTGFSVKSTAGQTGLLTAAHCPNSQTYATTSPYIDWYSSTFMSERLNSTTDIQWHRINPPNAAAIGYFYGQSGSSATKRTGSAVSYGGLYVCHRGRVHKGSIKSGASRAAFFTPIQRLASAFPNLSLL